MNHSRFFHRSSWPLGAALLMAGALLSSCTQNEGSLLPEKSETIRFEVAQVPVWQAVPQTRVADAGNGGTEFIGAVRLEGEDLADSLFLLRLLSDSSCGDGLPAVGAAGKSVASSSSKPCGLSGANGTLDKVGRASLTSLSANAAALGTRAAPVETETFYDAFGVSSYIYSGDWVETLTPDYFYNLEVTKDTDWSTSYFWPADERKLKFFAYAPFDLSSQAGFSFPGKSTAGTPVIGYAVPDSVANQKDILLAVTDGMVANQSSTAALSFYHALTAVRFITGNTMAGKKIASITLKNILSEGEHALGSAVWDLDAGSKVDFSQELSYVVTGPDSEITSGSATFMMLPQTLGSDAVVEIVRTELDGTQPETLTASIAGDVWPIGKTATYRISTTATDPTLVPIFEITPPEYTYAAGTYTFQVESRNVVEGTTNAYPLGWTAEFVTGDELAGYTVIPRPDWITDFPTSGTGSASGPETLNSTILQQEADLEHHADPLAAIPPVSGVYDLSTKGGTTPMNTANCYIVGAPGTYKLPLVYGNAIKNGMSNEESYITDNSYVPVTRLQSDRWLRMQNHRGAAITSPYIYENDQCEPADATLIWQDSEDLVTIESIALTSDNEYLTFTIPSGASFKQGNAIVAVRNAAGEVMWSWHIWVTVYDPVMDVTITNTSMERYKVMSANLGWCSYTVDAYYQERGVKVRFVQNSTGLSQVVDLHSNAYAALGQTGNDVYYQWGRKDPLLPQITNPDPTSLYPYVDKVLYYSDETHYVNSVLEPKYLFKNITQDVTTVKDAIKNPSHLHSYNGTRWTNEVVANLWSMRNTVKPYPSETAMAPFSPVSGLQNLEVVKTIYDPSPVGYKVPPADAFDGFTYQAYNVNTPYNHAVMSRFATPVFTGSNKNINTPYTSITEAQTNKGWRFYCLPMSEDHQCDASAGYIYFPQTGYRSGSGGQQIEDDLVGYYWTAQLMNAGQGSALRFNGQAPGSVTPNADYATGIAYAFAVRSIRDE